MTKWAVTGILVLKKMVVPRSQAVRIRIRVRVGSGDDMSTSECLGTSVMSRYGRVRSGNDLPDQHFRWTKFFAGISVHVSWHFTVART